MKTDEVNGGNSMTNMWTQERIKRFWGACGFIQAIGKLKRDYHYEFGEKVGNWRCPDGSLSKGFRSGQLPDITDLNNLRKYAVPKVLKIGYEIVLVITEDLCEVELNDKDFPPKKQSYLGQDKDPALALAKAIEKLI